MKMTRDIVLLPVRMAAVLVYISAIMVRVPFNLAVYLSTQAVTGTLHGEVHPPCIEDMLGRD